MDLNYLILAHKNLSQLDRLVKALTYKNTRFFIHIDKKIAWKELQKFDFFHNQHVNLVTDRFWVNWGGFNMVRATLTLMKAAASKSKNGYFILISGQDFPIKSNEHIHTLLDKNYGTQYMTYWSIPYEKWSSGGLDRIRYYWLVDKIGFTASRLFFHVQKAGKVTRTYPAAMPPFGGSQWWSLTYDCIKYMLDFVACNPSVFNFFSYTLIADEMFFQTIVLNSPFRAKVANDDLRYYTIEGLNSHPDLLGVKDLPNLVASGDLWARKFEEGHDRNIFELLERHLQPKDP